MSNNFDFITIFQHMAMKWSRFHILSEHNLAFGVLLLKIVDIVFLFVIQISIESSYLTLLSLIETKLPCQKFFVRVTERHQFFFHVKTPQTDYRDITCNPIHFVHFLLYPIAEHAVSTFPISHFKGLDIPLT